MSQIYINKLRAETQRSFTFSNTLINIITCRFFIGIIHNMLSVKQNLNQRQWVAKKLQQQKDSILCACWAF